MKTTLFFSLFVFVKIEFFVIKGVQGSPWKPKDNNDSYVEISLSILVDIEVCKGKLNKVLIYSHFEAEVIDKIIEGCVYMQYFAVLWTNISALLCPFKDAFITGLLPMKINKFYDKKIENKANSVSIPS